MMSSPPVPKKNAKELAAIKDKESDEEGDAEEDEEEDSKQRLNAAAKEADLLSDMGGAKAKSSQPRES